MMNTIRAILNTTHLTQLSTNITSKTIYRTFKSDLKIKWVRPEKIACIKPEKSGDLEGMPKIDKTQLQLKFRNCKELETADDIVKKLFTLEFASSTETLRTYLQDLKGKVKRHEYDVGTMEVRIAHLTGVIRAYQEAMERFPYNIKRKVTLKELIDKRKKYLKYLRRWDYRRFEWLLENLNIIYKAPPTKFHWITRKESLQKLTDKYCDGIRDERLNAYKLQLKAEQPAFLQEKIRCLEFIRNEQMDCGAAVTVTQEEIDVVKEQLEKLKRKNESTENE